MKYGLTHVEGEATDKYCSITKDITLMINGSVKRQNNTSMSFSQ